MRFSERGSIALAWMIIFRRWAWVLPVRAIRTTTGRALRVGRWSAPKPRRRDDSLDDSHDEKPRLASSHPP